MAKKHIVVGGLIVVVLLTAVIAVGISNNASPNEGSSINDGETQNEDITTPVQSDWDGSSVTIQVESEGGEATEIEARGDVTQTQTMDVRVGKSMVLSCSDLSESSGTVDVVAVDDNQVNTLESVEYSGC